jgi:hypothetical protein
MGPLRRARPAAQRSNDRRMAAAMAWSTTSPGYSDYAVEGERMLTAHCSTASCGSAADLTRSRSRRGADEVHRRAQRIASCRPRPREAMIDGRGLTQRGSTWCAHPPGWRPSIEPRRFGSWSPRSCPARSRCGSSFRRPRRSANDPGDGPGLVDCGALPAAITRRRLGSPPVAAGRAASAGWRSTRS